jgi:hypothetical protein
MRQENLRVIHLRKGPYLDPGVSAFIQSQLPEAFFLDSCQRQLWACSALELEGVEHSLLAGIEIFAGVEAYEFLLRVATGLESQIVGETDIFGQFKDAWRKCSGGVELGILMQRLFEDTKDIRSRLMQNLGGASYGSLVRMLLRNRQGPTLIVGAGQIAQSVAPYLIEGELWLTNRSRGSLEALHMDLLARQKKQNPPHSQIRMLESADEARAWREAANIVVCIPFDESRDAERVALRQAGGKMGGVIHLGGMAEQAGVWTQLKQFHSLSDLFALQKTQGDVRVSQIVQAKRACEEKAKLRALGASITIPHGWEDLAVFA